MTRVLSVLSGLFFGTRALEADCAAIGVTTVSLEKVRAFQKREVADHRARAGFLGRHPVLAMGIYYYGKYVVKFLFTWGMKEPRQEWRFLLQPLASCAALIAAGITCAYTMPLLGLLPGTILGLSLVVVVLAVSKHASEAFNLAAAHWESISLAEYRRREGCSSHARAEECLPEPLSRVATRVQELPGVRVEMDVFLLDPFIFAVRGRGPWRERTCIGYFNTDFKE
jgi:hypothetical protein